MRLLNEMFARPFLRVPFGASQGAARKMLRNEQSTTASHAACRHLMEENSAT